jgi:hypothetical protein
MIRYTLILTLTLALAAGAQQDRSTVRPDTSNTSGNQTNSGQNRQTETLSTEVGGLDSLGVLPSEISTSYQGGTRRVKLENTVFRRETPIAYNSAGRRDPFRALITDEKKEGQVQTDLLIVDGADLTGIVWAEGQYLAMIRDKDGHSFFLREGDAVYKGRVSSVNQTNVIIEISDFGDYHQVTLKVNG